MYVNLLYTHSDKKSCMHTSTTLQTSIARFVSDSWASCWLWACISAHEHVYFPLLHAWKFLKTLQWQKIGWWGIGAAICRKPRGDRFFSFWHNPRMWRTHRRTSASYQHGHLTLTLTLTHKNAVWFSVSCADVPWHDSSIVRWQWPSNSEPVPLFVPPSVGQESDQTAARC